ncbi:hypothetical protein ACH5RR_008472 [Cinchona calisaya]|uniref:Uncharacterized protein n=1 Tax=Cinchona calisaya TaxID=153742 RepID=A0ABD3AF30_9GENT
MAAPLMHLAVVVVPPVTVVVLSFVMDLGVHLLPPLPKLLQEMNKISMMLALLMVAILLFPSPLPEDQGQEDVVERIIEVMIVEVHLLFKNKDGEKVD